MATDSTNLLLTVGGAAAINSVSAMKANRDPVPALIASGIVFFFLATFAGLTNKWSLANAFAVVFLLASLITRGIPLVKSFTDLAKANPSTATATPKVVGGNSRASGSGGKATAGGGGGGGGGGGV